MNSFLTLDRAHLANSDPEIATLFAQESLRLNEGLELIASENVASPAVLAALSSVLSNKYAEGYPGRRYYGGCEFNDQVETIAIERVKKISGAEHANVQPHSGAQANQAVFLSCLNPGDTILGMSLSHGGHLTHGSPVNLSGIYYKAESYGVDENGDYLRKYVPELAHLSSDQIHEPWLYLDGYSKGYNERIVDHAVERLESLARLQEITADKPHDPRA